MKYYEKNMKKLFECMPHVKSEIEQLDKIELDKEQIWEENQRLQFLYEGKAYRLESKQPEEEVKLLLKNSDETKENLIFVLGIGNRQLLKVLADKIKRGSKVIIYEPNVHILKYMLETEDLTEFLLPAGVLVWYGKMDTEMKKRKASEIVDIKWEKYLYNINVITCPNYYMYMEEFKKLFIEVKDKIYQSYVALGNDVADVLQGVQQNVKNLVPCMESNCLDEIKDQYKGYPAIIVAAGPSLEKNIQYLKEAQGKAFIVCCDASWNACKMHGVKPDAIASIERVVQTYNFYYKGKQFDEDLVLLAPTLAWPDIYKDFSGKKIVISKDDDGVDGWWYQFFPNVKYLFSGMSCATLAYSVAKEAGCNPIILIGQDLAYTDNKKHSDITHTAMEKKNQVERKGAPMVEDIYGNMVPTSRVYNMFRFWYEDRIVKYPEVQIIDATEGGAKIKGSTIMPLKEAIQKYCRKDKEKTLYECLSDNVVTKQQIFNKCVEISDATEEMLQKLHDIKTKAEEHYEMLEEIYDQIDEKTSKEKLVKLVRKMQKGDNIVSYVMKQRDLVTFFQQYIAQTITHVKGIGNELTSENVIANIKIQGNLMGALKRTCAVLIKEYEDIQTILLEEKEKTGIIEE